MRTRCRKRGAQWCAAERPPLSYSNAIFEVHSMLKMTVPHLLAKCEEAFLSAEGFLIAAKSSVAELVMKDGKIDAKALDREQRATHGLAWLATYVEALRQMARWG